MMSSPRWLKKRQISSADISPPSLKNDQDSSIGRKPWYSTTLSPTNENKHKKLNTLLIGVAGGTASGKTSVCRAILHNLQLPWVQILSLDCFYSPLTKEQLDDVANYNFDHPDAFDWDLLQSVLKELKQGKAVKVPQYDFTCHQRKEECTIMYGADVVLVEGILMLYKPKICANFDLKIFVKTDDDIRLIRRIKRDMSERNRTLESVLDQYQKTVKPSYELYCEPTQSKADLVIPRGKTNIVAINLLCNHIKTKLIEGGVVIPTIFDSPNNKYENNNKNDIYTISDYVNVTQLDMKEADKLNDEELQGNELLKTISLLCSKLLIYCVESFIIGKSIVKSDKSDKSDHDNNNEKKEKETLSDLLFNNDGDDVSDLLSDKSVGSSAEIIFFDQDDTLELKSKGNSVCVVTVFSGGMLFGETVMSILGGNKVIEIHYGSLHIFHESHKPTKPRFYDRQLPINISEMFVVVLDAFIGTGNRARMALQVLIDHNVNQQNICFVSLISSVEGVTSLAKVFPKVNFVSAKIDVNNDNQNRKSNQSRMARWESLPVTSSLVVRYCEAAGIDIVDV